MMNASLGRQRPFLKWAGNKYRILEHINQVLPPVGGRRARRLVEPFVGAGAVFLNTAYPQALLNDINGDLMNLYTLLQHDVQDMIAVCRSLFTPETNTPLAYYALRQEFNQTTDPQRKAALFLYLNRHGYNGLCRYNARGGFNVPFGRYATPYFPAREIVAFAERLQENVTLRCGSFEAIFEDVVAGDVVYCDPPYVPLSTTANFTGYSAQGFGPQEQENLAELAEAAAARGATVILSNHDTPYTQTVYRSAKKIIPFDVRRTISCQGQSRGKASEMLAVFT